MSQSSSETAPQSTTLSNTQKAIPLQIIKASPIINIPSPNVIALPQPSNLDLVYQKSYLG
jgi:hypothetical protein